MTFSDWLDGERGRLAQVALRFGITMSAVTQWRSNGVPVDRMAEVSALTCGAVTIEDLVIRGKPAAKEAA